MLANLITNDATTQKMISYYFPIGPEYALRFIEEEHIPSQFYQEIDDGYEIQNRLIYDCSRFYLFSNERITLKLTTHSF